jgi:hypothetical protein
MNPGDTVRVHNPQRGEVVASILELTTPAALPSLPSHGFDELKTRAARAILEEWHVSQIALLSYRWNGPPAPREVCFFALRISGAWFDLKRQPLTIEPIGAPPTP